MERCYNAHCRHIFCLHDSNGCVCLNCPCSLTYDQLVRSFTQVLILELEVEMAERPLDVRQHVDRYRNRSYRERGNQ